MMNERDEAILWRLPQTLDDILTLHRMTAPNPMAGLNLRIEGGPLDGQRRHNDGTQWHGDDWEPEADGVVHRYVLGTRFGLGSREHLCFYKGVIDPGPDQ
jgi:hypothetical protein